jgi:hypothetical protein
MRGRRTSLLLVWGLTAAGLVVVIMVMLTLLGYVPTTVQSVYCDIGTQISCVQSQPVALPRTVSLPGALVAGLVGLSFLALAMAATATLARRPQLPTPPQPPYPG